MRTSSKVFYISVTVLLISALIIELLYRIMIDSSYHDAIWFLVFLWIPMIAFGLMFVAIGWYILERAIEDGVRRAGGKSDDE